MENQEFFKHFEPLAVYNPDRYGKATLFRNEYLMAGLNGLEEHTSELQSHV